MQNLSERQLVAAYELAKERYGLIGVDTETVLASIAQISLSLHCWQADDVSEFEDPKAELGGGLAVTGNYPGKARTPDELRRDLDMAYRLIPGGHRLNLHAIYLEAGSKVERNRIMPEHFSRWVDWARTNGHGLDFNPTCFSHPLAADGFTLSHVDEGIRHFWIEHCIACREIGSYFGEQLGTPAVTNIWIPDGYKDTPVDRRAPRRRLEESLDRIFSHPVDPRYNLDSLEAKLFGIGSESYVVGSHEFYLGYAIAHRLMLCLDAGHFHPTELISDKISAVMAFIPGLLLHVSRGVRWDSDHVVTYNDELQGIMQELVRGAYLDRTHIGLDYFDASINRVAAWVIGARNVLIALMAAMLEPYEQLRQIERDGDFTKRLALLEALKVLPSGAVWDYYCLQAGVPIGMSFLEEIESLRKECVISKILKG